MMLKMYYSIQNWINLDAQTSSNCFENKEMLHHGKHAPVPTILGHVAGIKFEMSSFCNFFNFSVKKIVMLSMFYCE